MSPMHAPGTPMDAFDYDLPPGAVAQRAVDPRRAARLLVSPELVPAAGGVVHATVADLATFVRPGDVVVVNETRVLAARLRLRKRTGGTAEVLLLEPADGRGPDTWEALVRPGRRLPAGTPLFEPDVDDAVVEIGERLGDDGRRLVCLLDPAVVDRHGDLPLPPYIRTRPDDAGRYQTVFAADSPVAARSAAAPTAGLHLDAVVLDACRRTGATVTAVDLTIGLDTFRPVTAATAEAHTIHSERYRVPADTLAACRRADRVVAVGTTTVRALETAAATGRLEGRTSLYVHGDYPFAAVDVLLTNFHLPRSTLLLLLEAFYGPRWRDLYAGALSAGYRFLSFGDAMLVGRGGGRA